MRLKNSNLERKRLDVPFEIKSLKKSGEFSGYGSVFGVIDSYRDVVAKGAFEASLAQHKAKGTLPAMLWQHRADQPIGVYKEMKEDEHGLYVEGQLATATVRGAEAYELLKMGAMGGLSIGFITKKYEDDVDENVRTLTEIDLWEISLVTFPANEAAQVADIKGAIEAISTVRDVETVLRDAGFSRGEAESLISRLKDLAREGDPGDAEAKALLESVERFENLLRA